MHFVEAELVIRALSSSVLQLSTHPVWSHRTFKNHNSIILLKILTFLPWITSIAIRFVCAGQTPCIFRVFST